MVDIQSAAAEIRRGKKEERKKERRQKPQGKNIMACPILHRVAIRRRRNHRMKIYMACPIT